VQQPVVDNSRANRPLEEERCGNGVPANGRLRVGPEHAFWSDHAWQQHGNSGNRVADARNSQPDARHGEPYSGSSYSSAGNSSGNDTHKPYSGNDTYQPNARNCAYESDTRNDAYEPDSREHSRNGQPRNDESRDYNARNHASCV
jgi:hypothetical protein